MICLRESGGPDVLTLPDTFHLRRIGGDGNCLFRAMSFIITGSESQHFEICTSIIAHMLNIPELLTGRGADGHNYLSYWVLKITLLKSTWLMRVYVPQILKCPSLDIVVYSYKAGQFWIACFPKGIFLKMLIRNPIYIYYTSNHYDVVTKILPRV